MADSPSNPRQQKIFYGMMDTCDLQVYTRAHPTNMPLYQWKGIFSECRETKLCACSMLPSLALQPCRVKENLLIMSLPYWFVLVSVGKIGY
jgi:hypothetical protein